MKTSKILICDTDTAYTDALVGFLVDSGYGVLISVINDPDESIDPADGYEAVILGSGFEDSRFIIQNGIRPDRLIRLISGDTCKDPSEEIHVDRFGSMEKLIQAIGRVLGESNGQMRHGGSVITGIYSPMHHELMLPAALAVCAILSEKKERVLFVDLEGLSILGDLTMDDGDLIDFFYLQETGKDALLKDHIRYSDGFYYLPAMKNPSEAAYITEAQWMRLIGSVESMGFDDVVILFDHVIQGFEKILSRLDEMVLITKNGDYYRKSEERFCNFIKDRGFDSDIKRINLSVNAGNLSDGSYSISSLIQGNLGEIIKKEWYAGER